MNFKSTAAYLTINEAIAVPDSAGANVVEAAGIPFSADQYDLGFQKVLASAIVRDATTGNGALEVRLEGSPNGHLGADAAWAELAVTTIALDSTAVGNAAAGVLDLANIGAPWYRFVVVTDGTDLGEAGNVEVALSYRTVLK